MYCYNCGKELNQNSRFCNACGTQVISQDQILYQKELNECKAEIGALQNKLLNLSTKIDNLSGIPQPMGTNLMPQNNMAQSKQIEKNQQKPISSHVAESVVQTPHAIEQPKRKTKNDMESNVGKNLFAIIASLLVLIGVGIFISTIYEYIPETVKVIAIYALGLAMTAVGVGMYFKGKNNFWLGLASCGTAELLVSIIASYTYFKIIPLIVTYILILLWVAGTLTLTKVKPMLFKIISYIGFLISMILGLTLLEQNDGPMFIMLFISYIAITCLFALTHKDKAILNTVLLYVSTLFSFAFFVDRFFLYDHAPQPVDLRIFIAVAIVIFNVIHKLRYKDLKESFATYSGASIIVIAICLAEINAILLYLLIAFAAFSMWFLHIKSVGPNKINMLYEALVALPILITAAQVENGYLRMLFVLLTVIGLTLLYKDTNDYGSAIFALISFPSMLGADLPDLLICAVFLIVSGGIFILMRHEQRGGKILKNVWYLWLIYAIIMTFQEIEYALYDANYIMTDLITTLSFVSVSALNLFRAFKIAFDKEKGMLKDPESIFLYVINGILFICGLVIIGAREMGPIEETLAVFTNLAIISFTILHSIRTNWKNQIVTMIHCIKFTFYVWFLMQVYDAGTIFINITVLVMAIASIILGFAKNSKPARIYGLVMSLLSSVTLVLFTVSFDSTLQVAGGTILCGLLCFAISFIYSKAEKALSVSKTEEQIDENELIEINKNLENKNN